MATRHARRVLVSALFPSRQSCAATGSYSSVREINRYRGLETEELCRNPRRFPSVTSLGLLRSSSTISSSNYVSSRNFAFWSRGASSSSGTGNGSGSHSDQVMGSIASPIINSHSDQSGEAMIDPAANLGLTGGDSDVNAWRTGENNVEMDVAGESGRTPADWGNLSESVVNESLGTTIWSILRLPADGVVALVDGVHTMTGAPWWLTIVGSTLAFRATIFPFTITYIKKSAQFASSMSLLPPLKPPVDSGKTIAQQYRIFTKRRLELGVPSPFWTVAGLAQAPLFLYWIVALRGMAMASHPGFDTGGVLWFSDLTVPVQGALGALFPTLVAVTYFINIQVSFRVIKPRNDVTGFFMKIYQWWLEAVTIPLFLMGFYLPQGVFMYWLTNNFFNLAQSAALQSDGFRANFGLPLLSDMEKQRAKQYSRSTESQSINPELLDLDGLLLTATQCVANDREVEAINLLKFTIEKYPDEPEIYNVYGMLHIKKRQWSEALEYYSLVMSKTEDDPPRITALMGAGIALYNQGKRGEAVNAMRPLLHMKVPKQPDIRVKYLRALVTLSSAMSQEGLKEEALTVLEQAAKWDKSIDVYVKELKEELGSVK